MTDEEALRIVQDRLSAEFDLKRLVIESKRRKANGQLEYSVYAVVETSLSLIERNGVAIMAMRDAEVDADIAVTTPDEVSEASLNSRLARALRADADRRRIIIESAREANRFLEPSGGRSERRGQMHEAFGETMTSARRERSSRLFAAFGETMTPGEWSRHDRCVVRYCTLFHRLGCGWPIEAALVVPTPITRRVFDAFGKAQAIQDWLADPCCAVPPSILLARLAAGESLEAALTRPEAGYQAEVWPRFANRPRRDDTKRKYEAFGEARTVTQWAKDARCVVALAVLQHRIYAGIPAETAMIFGEYGLKSRYWAFGERRTLAEWLRDPRLKHVGADFKRRLDEGAKLEDALGITPATEPAMTRVRGQILIEIEGERKSATRWAKDPRCEICKTYLVDRIKRGWPATLDILKYSTNNKKSLTSRYEARLSSGTVLGGYPTTRHAFAAVAEHGVGGQVFDSLIGAVYEPRPEPTRVRPRRYGGPYEQHTALGETKTLEEWAADPRCRVTAHRLGGRLARGWPSEAAIVLPTAWHRARPGAFGIADSIQHWLADPRCAVPASVLLERMAQGELFESALTRPEPGHAPEVWIKGTEPTRNPFRALEAARATLEQSYRRFEAFGKTLTVAEWAQDERCVVSLGTLAARLKRGWPIQAALLIPNLGNGDLLDAFGKGQPIQDWLADPICVVPPSILLARLAAGEPLESALTRSEPGHPPEVWPRFQNRPMRDAKKCKYEAFGEARTITQWAKDPRCVVGLRVLEDRISKGIPAEAAMIYSQYELMRRHSILGERRALKDWLRDPRFRNAGMDFKLCADEGTLSAEGLGPALNVDPALLARGSQPGAERRRAIIESAREPNRFLEPAGTSRERDGRMYEAFGESKTSAEWRRDARCAVHPDTFHGRLRRGWPTEAALLVPLALGNGGLLDAFGKGQPIQEWLADPCCVVPASILLARLAAGEDLETALTRPEPGYLPEVWPRYQDRPTRDALKRKFGAFGEARTLSQWLKDPRCVVGLPVLEKRIYSGIPAEAAMIFGDYGLMSHYWAFGERRRLKHWLPDPRFKHAGVEFKRRLEEGALIEEALGIAPSAEPAVTRVGAYIFLEIEGERKGAQEWARDPRCEIADVTLRDRIKKGWPATPDILQHIPNNKVKTNYRYEARLSDGTVVGAYQSPRKAQAALANQAIEGHIFDRHTKVAVEPLVEVANVCRRPPPTAFGETKTLEEWARDPRCRISGSLLAWRSVRGWPVEAAMVFPREWAKTRRTAFGEKKRLQGWLADPRCAVPAAVLIERLEQGEPLQSALTRPEPGRPPEVWIMRAESTTAI